MELHLNDVFFSVRFLVPSKNQMVETTQNLHGVEGVQYIRHERLQTVSDCSNNRLDWIEKGLEELLLAHGPNISNL